MKRTSATETEDSVRMFFDCPLNNFFQIRILIICKERRHSKILNKLVCF